MEMPSAAQITAALATVGMAAQYFGLVLPTQATKNANREAAWSFADQLKSCDTERKELLGRLLDDELHQ